MTSVLTPIKYDKEHWLLPAAATLNNGAACVNEKSSKALPSLYPKKHIYVKEGYVIPKNKDGNLFFVPDGSPEKPYTSLETVLSDPALRKVIFNVPYDYFHIHWAVPKKITMEITTKNVEKNYFRNYWCLFLGDGFDFRGHVIIEPWVDKPSIDISVEINCVTKLQDLIKPTEENGFKKSLSKSSQQLWFEWNRHCPDFAWRRFALFANYKGVFFYKVNANVNITYTYTNYLFDEYGNNSPLHALDWDANDSKWILATYYNGASFSCWFDSDCIGIYKCDCKATVKNLLSFPDVEDNVPNNPKKEDDAPLKNIGKLSPNKKTFDLPNNKYGEGWGNRKKYDSTETKKLKKGIGKEGAQDLFFLGGGSEVVFAKACDKLRMANNTFVGIINEETSSGSCGAYGLQECHETFCRENTFMLNAYTKQEDRKVTLKFNNEVDKLYPQVFEGACVAGSTMGYMEKNSTFINTHGSLYAHAVKKLHMDEDLYNGNFLPHAYACVANFANTLDCYFYEQSATRKATVDCENPYDGEEEGRVKHTCSAVLVNGFRSKFVKGTKHDRVIRVYQRVIGNKIVYKQ